MFVRICFWAFVKCWPLLRFDRLVCSVLLLHSKTEHCKIGYSALLHYQKNRDSSILRFFKLLFEHTSFNLPDKFGSIEIKKMNNMRWVWMFNKFCSYALTSRTRPPRAISSLLLLKPFIIFLAFVIQQD